jgi:hypothetical protein
MGVKTEARARMPQPGSMPQVPSYEIAQCDLELDGKRVRGLQVTCKRCSNWFIVHGSKWRKASTYATRPCPHCFKVSKL